MTITPYSIDRPAQAERMRRRAKTGSAHQDAFSQLLETSDFSVSDAELPDQPLTAPVLDALLCLQDVKASPAHAAAVERGGDLLDRLEQLRRSILGGSLSHEQLEALTEKLRAPRESSGDPSLDDLLTAIETRAEIEVAKFDRSTGNRE